jgi:hypothetical protein
METTILSGTSNLVAAANYSAAPTVSFDTKTNDRVEKPPETGLDGHMHRYRQNHSKQMVYERYNSDGFLEFLIPAAKRFGLYI